MILDQLKTAEAEVARIRNIIADFGRAIYEIRTETTIGDGFAFWGISQFSARQDGYYDEEDELSYPEGTPLVTIHFYNKRWEENRDVTVTADYFDDLEGSLARDREGHVERQAKIAEAKAAADNQRKQKAEADRRALYEKLHAEYGSGG